MDIRTDLRWSLRVLARAPAFTVPAVASLALGIAANTTMFTVVSAALLRPFAAQDPGELVRIGRSSKGAQEFKSLMPQELAYLQEHAASLTGVLGEQMETAAIGSADGTRTVAIEFVTANYFAVLQVSPLLGRAFSADADRGPDADSRVVISDGLWRGQFASDPAIVGRPITLNNVQLDVIGVAPPGFRGTFPGLAIDVWVPVAMAKGVLHRAAGGDPSMGLIGRLRRGVSIETARAELQVLARRMADENPARDRERGFAIAEATGVHPGLAGPLRLFLSLLMGVVSVVLLIACTNVAGLLLARANARRQEMAVRLAVGASRRRLIALLLVESILLAAAGGVVGVVLAIWPVRLLNAFFTLAGPGGVPTFLDLRLDSRVLLFTAVVSMATTIVFGLLPAFQATRVDLVSAMKDSGPRGRPRARLRATLMVVQVAFSFVLLVAALLLFRSLRNSGTIDPGFEIDRVVVASFEDLRTFGYSRSRVDSFYGDWLARTQGLPHVERAALATFVGSGGGHPVPFYILDGAATSGQTELAARVGSVSTGYFATVGLPLIRGRDFTDHDRSRVPRVAIVNEAMAHRVWRDADPLGKRFGLGEDRAEYEVVGVARDAGPMSFGAEVESFVHLLAAAPTGTLHVRTASAPSQVLPDIKRLAHSIEPNLPPFAGRPMRDAMSERLVPVRIAQLVFAVAGAIALFLATGGLYGLVAYTLEQRFKEIGIRIALGATRADLFRVIVGGTIRLAAVGLAIGLAMAVAATRLLAWLLYGLSPTDSLTFGGTAALLAIATLAAGYAAARKGLEADPMVTLRYE